MPKKPRPEPHQSIKLYLPASQVEKLKQEAELEGKTLTGIVRVLVREHLASRDAAEAAA